MKKGLFLVAAIATMLSLGSCNDEQKYQEFASTFAEAVSKGDTSVVKQMMKDGDQLSLASFSMVPITSGSLQMEALQDKGYKMTWGDKIAIVKPEAGDKLVISELYKVFTCNDNARLETAKRMGLVTSDENIEMIKGVCSDQVNQALGMAEAEAETASLNDIPETFYRKSHKAVPILPSFTKSFGDVMRHTQSDAGYSGIKGYICYCFWGDWIYRSDADIYGFSTSGYNTEKIDDTHAAVSVRLTMKLRGPEGNSTMSFNDKFMLVKTGGSWKIDDIIRDGKSLHEYFKSYRPYIP